MKYIAYDYEAQKWIEGEPARLLRIEQLTLERVLLMSPKGAQFAGRYGVKEALRLRGSRTEDVRAMVDTERLALTIQIDPRQTKSPTT